MAVPNFLAILVAAVAHMALGAFWYSPAGFGKQWIKLSGFEGKDQKKMQEEGKKAYPVAFLQSLVIASVFGVILLAAPTIGWAITVAILIWLGFIATTHLNPVLWSEQPFELYVINSFYFLAGFMVIAVIIAGWPWL